MKRGYISLQMANDIFYVLQDFTGVLELCKYFLFVYDSLTYAQTDRGWGGDWERENRRVRPRASLRLENRFIARTRKCRVCPLNVCMRKRS